MQFHFEMMKDLKTLLNSPDYKEEEVNKEQVSHLLIHLSDLSSPMKTWNIARIWSQRVTTEFMAQNKMEESLKNIPVTPFMKNLHDPKIMADQEAKFIQYVVIPYANVMNQLFNNDLKEMVNNLTHNMNTWNERVKEKPAIEI